MTQNLNDVRVIPRRPSPLSRKSFILIGGTATVTACASNGSSLRPLLSSASRPEYVHPCTGDGCPEPTPGRTPNSAILRTISSKSTSSYYGFVGGPYGSQALPTVDGTSQSFLSGSPGALRVGLYGAGTVTLPAAAISATSPFQIQGITFTPYAGSNAVTFTHPQAGSGVIWYDPSTSNTYANFSFDSEHTYVAGNSASKPPPNPWPIIFGGIALGLGAVAAIIAIAALTAPLDPVFVAIGAITALVALLAGGIALGIDMGEYASEMNDSQASSAKTWTTSASFNGGPTVTSISPPPPAVQGSGGSDSGGGAGSIDVPQPSP